METVPCVLFCTVPTQDVASRIAHALVSEKLVACVNIIPNLTSVYTWEEKVCEDAELLLMMKSKSSLFESIKMRILELHPYKVPEIILLDIKDGHDAYLSWIGEVTM